jgi:hypothetical protein
MGFQNIDLMPDPTLLLNANEYESLVTSSSATDNQIFFYSLHSGQKTIRFIKETLTAKKQNKLIECDDVGPSGIGVEEWLSHIKNAKLVVTNSFHGVVFSILFKRHFIAVPVEGNRSGMNDRILTLLGQLGLDDHILTDCSQAGIDKILNLKIDWTTVTEHISSIRSDAHIFFKSNLT